MGQNFAWISSLATCPHCTLENIGSCPTCLGTNLHPMPFSEFYMEKETPYEEAIV